MLKLHKLELKIVNRSFWLDCLSIRNMFYVFSFQFYVFSFVELKVETVESFYKSKHRQRVEKQGILIEFWWYSL